MLLVFLPPVPPTPVTEPRHFDKVVHFGIFLGFALLYRTARSAGALRIMVTSFAFAAAIELAQWALPYRKGDWWDLVADMAGAITGAFLVYLIELPRKRV
jgi:VanZ family protein